MNSSRVAIAPIRVYRRDRGDAPVDHDLVTVEAPLSVSVSHSDRKSIRSLGIVMRTPGDDRDLASGLLVSEALIRKAEDIVELQTTTSEIHVTVTADVRLDQFVDRAMAGTSACGICGRLLVDGAESLAQWALDANDFTVDVSVVADLPRRLTDHQAVFAETGGLHAAGLFDPGGNLVAIREDIGRHNAVDKIVGAVLRAGGLPARNRVLVVSGRVAFEIVQKAVLAGIAMVVAVGAPSDLAVAAARAARLTLVGFARDGGFNVYTSPDRIARLDGTSAIDSPRSDRTELHK